MALTDGNFTRVFRLFEFINIETSGVAMPYFLFIFYLIFFTGLLRRGPGVANLGALCIVTIVSIYFRWANFVQDWIMFIFIFLFAISAAYMVYNRD